MTKVVLLNDTTRDIGHIGCETVVSNLSDLCENNGWDVIYKDKNCSNNFDYTEFLELIKPANIVILNGEGSMHDDAASVWLEKVQISKEHHKHVYLVNTVWQNNPKNKRYLNCFDFVSVRESLSLSEIRADGYGNAVCVPDLVFYSFSNLQKSSLIKPLSSHMVIESTQKKMTSQLIEYAQKHRFPMYFMYSKRYEHYCKKWKYILLNYYYHQHFNLLSSYEQLYNAQSIISGRYHACCFAMMLGIPVLGLASNTWKIRGLYQDADLLKYFLPTFNTYEVEKFVKMQEYNDFIEAAETYSNSAEKSIKKMFKELK